MKELYLYPRILLFIKVQMKVHEGKGNYMASFLNGMKPFVCNDWLYSTMVTNREGLASY